MVHVYPWSPASHSSTMLNSSLDDVISRMDYIYKECGGKEEPVNEEEKGPAVLTDEFSIKRMEIHEQVQTIRGMIKERDEKQEEAGNDFSEKIVRLGQDIRAKMAALTKDVDRLEAKFQENSEKKRKKFTEDELSNQEAIVSLCRKHLTEVENLEKKRYSQVKSKSNSAMNQAVTALFKGAKRTAPDPTVSDLPEINGDIADGLRVIDQQKKMIDDSLDVIGEGLAVIRQQVDDIADELEIQNEMVETLNQEAEETQEKLDTEISRAKALLDRVKKNDRVLIYVIMIMVCVAIVVWLFAMVFSYFKDKITAALGL
ncbi:hypothetical protein J8273_6532 [Carpediemonas membranifera]|uniref:t-SNARE coiled-coil homology domain-containing protein n=1 Tax=Carpediemonas membranifera TaxID=201153 RepID=A0A8J6AQQ4_9EUKA|nr:hypothetical protein J8273_6532 [Carpediemonas membranifera]|eukprot:KAG9391756.1 hypothetical protein J8273_6532 [Carpediemonas membranifera]